ncbi:MAG: hypothetical protein ACK4QL_05055 [Pseudanabaenaceae cyanobacterium]
MNPISILENYSRSHPQQVLLVAIEVDGQPDQIMIYKGFSSSLVNPTPPDPDVPVIPSHAHIRTIDLLQAPYQPRSPQYLQRNLDLSYFCQS